MRPTRHSDPDLDDLICEITIDCHDEDEQLQARRRELIATCRRNGRSYQVALLDIDLNADATTSHLLEAYRRRNGD